MFYMISAAYPPEPLLYPFRFRDPLTGRWLRARYKAMRDEIQARYTEAEIIGPAEIRRPIDKGFVPWR
jgi:hypothetical protein